MSTAKIIGLVTVAAPDGPEPKFLDTGARALLFAGSSGWFGISVLMTPPVTPPSHLMNGAMRSHNAADQSHLRRPSARCRRQSRGPQRSIPNRPLRR